MLFVPLGWKVRATMGIHVKCPHGHVFKVKDKYAGKKGLCPKCEGQVVVLVPDATSSEGAKKAYRQAVLDEHRATNPVADAGDSSVFDDSTDTDTDTGSSASGSLLGDSVIRHNVKCTKCGKSVPMWFAKCPECGDFIEH